MAPKHMNLTRPTPTVWQISLNSPPDNRLHPDLLAELGSFLDIVEAEWREQGDKYKGAGALVLTSDIPKFFSNGLHPSSLGDRGGFFENVYDPITYRLITFPLITIAAVNGHAFAGGMVLSLCCDFRVMTGNRGMMSMNEIFLGVPLPNSFNTLLKQRMSYPALRDTLLGKRWKQSELLAAGIIDEIVDDSKDPKAVVKRAIELGTEEGPKVAKGAWGGIKEGVYHDYIDSSRSHRQLWLPDQKEKAFWDRLDRNNKAKL